MFIAKSMSNLIEQGCAIVPSGLPRDLLASLCDTLFASDVAGSRCLLDQPCVRQTAIRLRTVLISSGVLSHKATAIQAIAFDKTAAINWKVTWHQDLMFPLAHSATSPGYDLPAKKDAIDYARPPRAVLEALLAVRLHLDDCDASNGPLRVSPGSHRGGVRKSPELTELARRFGELPCIARTGDILLMKPLLLHASSLATNPRHRRVLHLVYYDGPPPAEPWHRSL